MLVGSQGDRPNTVPLADQQYQETRDSAPSGRQPEQSLLLQQGVWAFAGLVIQFAIQPFVKVWGTQYGQQWTSTTWSMLSKKGKW